MLKKVSIFYFFITFLQKKGDFTIFLPPFKYNYKKKIPHNKICIIKCNVDKYNINKIFRYTLFI